MTNEITNPDRVIEQLARLKRFSHLRKEQIERLVDLADKDPDKLSPDIRNYITFVIQSTGATDNPELMKEIISLNEEIMTLIDYKTMRFQLERSWAPVWQLSDYLTQGQQGTVPASLRCHTSQLVTVSISDTMANQETIIYKYMCKECRRPYSYGASEFDGPNDHKSARCKHTKDVGRCKGKNAPIQGGSLTIPVITGQGSFYAKLEDGRVMLTPCYIVSFATNVTVGEQLVAGILYQPDGISQMVLWILAADVPHKKDIPMLLDAPDLTSVTHAVDKFIEQEAHIKIEKAQLFKELYILQALSYARGNKKVNMAIMGMKDIGKSFVFRPYQQVLYEPAKWTRNDSLSIAALRGTVNKFFIGNKEVSRRSDGFFVTFENIFVDEMLSDADTNGKFAKDSLMTELKGYLLDDVVDYSKAGGDGVERPKKAIMNIAANVPPHYIVAYKKEIEKEHKKLLSPVSGGMQKFESLNVDAFAYDSGLDYFGPLDEYYAIDEKLGDAVKNVRRGKGNLCWQNNIEDAVMKRFPLRIYVRGDRPLTLSVETMAFNSERVNDKMLTRTLANKTWREYVAIVNKRIADLPKAIRNEVIGFIKDYVASHQSEIQTENVDITTQEVTQEIVFSFMGVENITELTPRLKDFIASFLSINGSYVTADRTGRGIL